MAKFHAMYYNFIAKRIREVYPNPLDYGGRGEYLSVVDKLNELAVNLAKKFAEDNEVFDPVNFLDACSPDPDNLPLSELWDE